MSESENIDPSAEELLDLLYDELDEKRASQAREALQLDSDRAETFASYQRVRGLVAQLPQEEPPEGLTAQLLHTAALAGKRRRGIFAWFTGLMEGVALHPGLAAAASLILVVGIAGTWYLAGKDQFATSVSPSATAPAAERAAMEKEEPTAKSEESAKSEEADDMETAADRAAPAAPLRKEGITTNGDVVRPSKPARRSRASNGKSRSTADRLGPKRKARSKLSKSEKKSRAKAPPVREKAPLQYPLRSLDRDQSSKVIVAPESSSRKIEQEAVVPKQAGSSASSPGEGFAEEPPAAEDATIREKQQQQKKLYALHQRAQKLARGKRCGQARTLVAQIRKIDRNYYKKSIVPDTRLTDCLNTKQKATKKRAK